jgi:transcription initiation factor TFIIIB Brf1 subunit/transcription initiation factor TFIIB
MLVTLHCKVCGKEYQVKPYLEHTSKYCSQSCNGKSRTGAKNPFYGKKHKPETNKINSDYHKQLTGEKNHFFGKNHSEETKQQISEKRKEQYTTEEYRSSYIEGRKKMWKRPEYREHQIQLLKNIEKTEEWRRKNSISHAGERNRNFIKDKQRVYCSKFNRPLKWRVRAFFNFTCVVCGAKENGKVHDVHHVLYDKAVLCNEKPRLFVPLCRTCHMKTNYNREEWKEYFEKLIKEKYGGRCYFTIEEFIEDAKEC